MVNKVISETLFNQKYVKISPAATFFFPFHSFLSIEKSLHRLYVHQIFALNRNHSSAGNPYIQNLFLLFFKCVSHPFVATLFNPYRKRIKKKKIFNWIPSCGRLSVWESDKCRANGGKKYEKKYAFNALDWSVFDPT